MAKKSNLLLLTALIAIVASMLFAFSSAVFPVEPLYEVGDAPDSRNHFTDTTPTGSIIMTAYPATPDVANYPVVFDPGLPLGENGHGFCHEQNSSYLGTIKSYESDADIPLDEDGPNANPSGENIYPPTDTADQDEVIYDVQNGDDGLHVPKFVGRCTETELEIDGFAINNSMVANVWIDWTQDGDWNDGNITDCSANEWAVQNFPVPQGDFTINPTIYTPDLPGLLGRDYWIRVTLSEVNVDAFDSKFGPVGGQDTGCFNDGETEDYFETINLQSDQFMQILGFLEHLHAWAADDFATYYRGHNAKAQPDECFYGLGNENNFYNPEGVSCETCAAGEGESKVNQAYVWGLTKASDNLWFGTAPNVHCMVLGGYLGSTGPVETSSYACEFGLSPYAPPFPSGDAIGDWRPPRLFKYNTQTRVLNDITPADPLVGTTLGIRSAGSHNGVAILAGPGFGTVNLFAFNTDTGAYIGSEVLPGANNIRKWLIAGDELYTTIGTADGGLVLKWTGDQLDPFQFETVGELDSAGAEIEEHEGRIFVTTWPGAELIGSGDPVFAGLYMSPTVDPGGLTTLDTYDWEKVWESIDYEPDTVTAYTYGGGALASYNGKLYWGTMHVPMLSTLAHFSFWGSPEGPEDLLKGMLGTYRPISIFRGDNFDGEPNIELVYGMPKLPAYHPLSGWILVDNNMGGEWPLYGPSGFGNPFNNYTWTMDVFDDQLFVGTMDWSYLLFGEFSEQFGLPEELPISCESFPALECETVTNVYNLFVEHFDPNKLFGADLWRFADNYTPAVPESLAGFDNYLNYGIRTMVADEEALWLGMANPMNLKTCSDDGINGGWEVNCLDDDDTDGDGIADCGDNCPLSYNPDQADLNGNNRGDICESDNRNRDGDDDDTDPPAKPASVSILKEIVQEEPEAQCLFYNDAREILYKDSKVEWMKPYVDFMSKLYFFERTTPYHILNGYQTLVSDFEKTGELVKPARKTTRFEAVIIALKQYCIAPYTTAERMANSDPENDFVDFPRLIDENHPGWGQFEGDYLQNIANYMYKAKDLGIIQGQLIGESRYAAWDSFITRAELFVTFLNASGMIETGNDVITEADRSIYRYYYDDVPVNHWAFDYVPFAAKHGIVAVAEIDPEVHTGVRFAYPNRLAVRGEVLAMGIRTLYITSSLNYVHPHSGFNVHDSFIRDLIIEIFDGTERSEFLLGILDYVDVGLANKLRGTLI